MRRGAAGDAAPQASVEHGASHTVTQGDDGAFSVEYS
jgi:hypothetical protein